MSGITVSEPSLGVQTQPHPAISGPMAEIPNKDVVCHLIDPTDMAKCHFWIGFFPNGKIAPQQLWTLENDYQLFEKVAEEGVAEHEPLMLSDSSIEPAKFTYLLPKPKDNEEEYQKTIDLILDTVRSLSPESIGIYLPKKLLSKEECHNLLSRIVEQLVLGARTREFFVLPGDHGVNAILNVALGVKQKLLDKDVNLFVFH